MVDLVVTGGRVGDGLEVPEKTKSQLFFVCLVWVEWWDFCRKQLLKNMVGFVE